MATIDNPMLDLSSAVADMVKGSDEGQLRELILGLTEEYARRYHSPARFCPVKASCRCRARSMARECAIWWMPASISG
jgi:hypothetical protein